MFDQTFVSLYDSSTSTISGVTAGDFLMCCLFSIGMGVVAAIAYTFRHKYSKNFVVTLALLPLIVQMVITLVNGNLGAGVSVVGVFSLVRFRSVPGSAKDIASVFLVMAIGLATGMGYLGLAVLFTFLVVVVNIALMVSPLGSGACDDLALRVTVPEDLEFNGMFDEVLDKYASHHELQRVKTTNMGSLFQLDYAITMKDMSEAKAMMDEMRCLNGNLAISLGHVEKNEAL